MIKLNLIIKSLLWFVLIYFGSTFLHFIPSIERVHSGLYCGFGQIIVNTINPSIFTNIVLYDGEEGDKYDVSYELYERKQYSGNLSNSRYRESVKPRFVANRKINNYIHLPSILLLSLILATPQGIKPKLISLVSGFLIFYIYISIYISYSFEQAFYGEDFVPSSIWQNLVKFIGGFGVNEQIFLVVVVIWGLVCFSPSLWKKIQSPPATNQKKK